MSIMDKVVGQFQARMTGELRTIEVPEWETVIHCRPSWSLKQQAPVTRLMNEGKTEEALVQTLIVRALDAEGKPLFRQADMTELLRKADPIVVSRVVTEITSADALPVEELEKN